MWICICNSIFGLKDVNEESLLWLWIFQKLTAMICKDIPTRKLCLAALRLSSLNILLHVMGQLYNCSYNIYIQTFSVFTSKYTSCEYNYNIFNCRVLYFNGNNVILNVERFAKNVEFCQCIWQIALLNQSKWSKLNKTIKYFDCLQMLMPA